MTAKKKEKLGAARKPGLQQQAASSSCQPRQRHACAGNGEKPPPAEGWGFSSLHTVCLGRWSVWFSRLSLEENSDDREEEPRHAGAIGFFREGARERKKDRRGKKGRRVGGRVWKREGWRCTARSRFPESRACVLSQRQPGEGRCMLAPPSHLNCQQTENSSGGS